MDGDKESKPKNCHSVWRPILACEPEAELAGRVGFELNEKNLTDIPARKQTIKAVA